MLGESQTRPRAEGIEHTARIFSFLRELETRPMTLKKVKTYKEGSSVKLVKIPGGSSSILFFCRYLQEQVILTYFMTRMHDSYTTTTTT